MDISKRIKKYYTDGRIFLFISFCFGVIVAAIIFSFSSTQYICSLLIDDAAYYPQIAWNIASGNGSTFDNITLTNGYHPLWCWLNIPFSLLGKDAMARLLIFKSLIVVIVLAMLLVWFFLLRKIGLSYVSIAFFILLMGGGYWWSIKVYYSGLEIPLVTLMIGLSLLIAHYTYKKPNVKLSILLGIATAATFLSRLDSIFFVVILYLFLIYKNKKINKEMIIAVFVFTAISLPYLIWNKINFGSFIPLSGIKKSRYGISDLMENLSNIQIFSNLEIKRLAQFINPYTILLILFLFFFIACGIIKIYKHRKAVGKKYEIFSIVYYSAIAHFIYNLFFMSEITVNWYQYLIYLSIFILLTAWMDWLLSSGASLRIYNIFYICLVILFGVMLRFGFNKFPRDLGVATIDAATFARNHTPQDTIYGMCDPGVFRFVSDRRTVAFNGLIGNPDTMNLVLSGQLKKLVGKYNVKYYVIIISSDEVERLDIKPVYLSKRFTYPGFNHIKRDTYVAIFKADEFFKHTERKP